MTLRTTIERCVVNIPKGDAACPWSVQVGANLSILVCTTQLQPTLPQRPDYAGIDSKNGA